MNPLNRNFGNFPRIKVWKSGCFRRTLYIATVSRLNFSFWTPLWWKPQDTSEHNAPNVFSYFGARCDFKVINLSFHIIFMISYHFLKKTFIHQRWTHKFIGIHFTICFFPLLTISKNWCLINKNLSFGLPCENEHSG